MRWASRWLEIRGQIDSLSQCRKQTGTERCEEDCSD